MILAAGLALSRCLVYALGLWAAWLHTCLPFVLQIRLIPDLPACLQLGSQLFPICKCSLDALGCTCFQLVYQHLPVCCGCSELHGSTLAPHLSPTGPPCVCKSIVGVLGRTILHFCPACLPLVSDCLPVCSGCSALFPDCLHGYFGCSVPHEPTLVSPLSLLLSPNKLWVLWAAGSYTCFPLVFYCLTVRCSVGALGYFVFSFVSCLSPSMPCCAISEAVYCRVRWCIIGVVGACLPLVSTRFPFASQVCSCDFVLWDRRLYFATTCLPLVYRFFFLSAEDLGPEYFLYCISYLSLICRLLLSLCCP